MSNAIPKIAKQAATQVKKDDNFDNPLLREQNFNNCDCEPEAEENAFNIFSG